MRTFFEFIEKVEDDTFQSGLCELLTPIVEGHKSFDELVHDVILPTFQESTYMETEQEVLSELLDRLKAAWQGFRNPQQPQQQVQQGPNPRHVAAANALNKQVQDLITQQLVPVIDKITNTMKQQAFQNNDRKLYQAADLFANRLKTTAAKIKFQVGARKVTPDERSQWQSAKLNNRLDRYAQAAARPRTPELPS